MKWRVSVIFPCSIGPLEDARRGYQKQVKLKRKQWTEPRPKTFLQRLEVSIRYVVATL